MDLKEKSIFEQYNVDPEKSWWEYSRIKLLKHYFPGIFRSTEKLKILDFGAGAAITSKKIARQNAQNQIIAYDIGYERNHTDQNLENLSYIKKVKKDHYDVILCMDVLEHIENEEEAIKDIKNMMDETTTLLVTVPAHQWLWSSHDEFLDHKRRYSKDGLKSLLEKHFDLELFEYHFSLLFWPAAIYRYLFQKSKKQNLRPAGAVVNFILKRVMDVEYSKINIFRKLFGLSLVARCRQKRVA